MDRKAQNMAVEITYCTTVQEDCSFRIAFVHPDVVYESVQESQHTVP